MIIGLFTDTYLPDCNGVATSVATLKEGLEAMGHQVFVITSHRGLDIDFQENILRLPGIKLRFLYGYKMSSPIQIRATSLIDEMQLDVIHIHTEAGVGTFGRYMAFKRKLPVVYTYHTMYEDYTHYMNHLNLRLIEAGEKKAVQLFSEFLSNKSQVVIAPSAKTRDKLIGYGVKSRIEIVQTGLDLCKFDKANILEEKIEAIKEDLGITPDMKTIVYVGRIAEEKMIDMPIKAMKYISDPSIKLIVVGGGPTLNRYQELAKKENVQDKVLFTGMIEKEEIPYYYHAFDCFVSASTTETQGMTYIEALASGLPIFVRRDEVVADILREGETGYYFDDEEELANNMAKFFQKQDIEEMKCKCREVSRKYSIDIFANAVLKIYESLTETDDTTTI